MVSKITTQPLENTDMMINKTSTPSGRNLTKMADKQKTGSTLREKDSSDMNKTMKHDASYKTGAFQPEQNGMRETLHTRRSGQIEDL